MILGLLSGRNTQQRRTPRFPYVGVVFLSWAEPDGENIKEGDAWNLVSYILSLRTPSAGTTAMARNAGSSASLSVATSTAANIASTARFAARVEKPKAPSLH